MKLNTEGIVLSEQKLTGGKCLLTILTRNNGILRCFAKDAKKSSDKYGAATSLFCYSNMSIFEGRKSNNLDDAVSKVLFYNIMFDIEKLALAQYFAELAIQVIPEGAGDPEYLSLMLNSLYLLHNDKKHELAVKAVFELRLIALSGFMPDIVGCRGCGLYEDDVFYFDMDNSCLWCKNCVRNNNAKAINKNVLNAVRTAFLAEPKKIFSFQISQKDTYLLADLAELYTLKITDRSFKTLDYYKKIKYNSDNTAAAAENVSGKKDENNEA